MNNFLKQSSNRNEKMEVKSISSLPEERKTRIQLIGLRDHIPNGEALLHKKINELLVTSSIKYAQPLSSR